MNPRISRLWPLLAPISMSIDFTHSKTKKERNTRKPDSDKQEGRSGPNKPELS